MSQKRQQTGLVNLRPTYDPEKNLYYVSTIDGEFQTKGPLNVGFQITRRCNLKCIYCSESPNLPDLDFPQIVKSLENLKDAGVLKINLTGGEALLRRDLKDIVQKSVDLGFYVAIDSNAVLVTDDLADFLKGKITYFESTIDGTPETHNRVRGRYDDVISGIQKIVDRNIPTYLAMVVLGRSIEDVKHVLKTGHELGVKYIKFLTPIPKNRGKSLPKEYLENPYLDEIWEEICQYKKKEGLTPSISLADWKKIGRGSVILINSDGEMVGSPSIGEPECVTPMGNILKQSVKDMWRNYPHKDNHIKKYIGDTMYYENNS
jgi:MoaA/NifB/PqqE/SkfB family radical SAM enzyme